MTEQEIADDIGILDKACRQCGSELAQGGLAALEAHAVAVNAMLAKWGRLQAEKAAQMNGSAAYEVDVNPASSPTGN